MGNVRSSRGVQVALFCLAVALLVGMFVPATLPAAAGRAHLPEYTVKAGDTLWGLAARLAPERDPRGFVFEMMKANGLEAVTIFPGQKLILP